MRRLAETTTQQSVKQMRRQLWHWLDLMTSVVWRHSSYCAALPVKK
jgi:hypothetical protein